MTLSDHDQVVQVSKITMIVRKKGPIPLDRMSEMNGIVIAAQADIRWDLHIVARLREQMSQERTGGIVIQIEPHKRLSRAISSGESRRGLAWYL